MKITTKTIQALLDSKWKDDRKYYGMQFSQKDNDQSNVVLGGSMYYELRMIPANTRIEAKKIAKEFFGQIGLGIVIRRVWIEKKEYHK